MHPDDLASHDDDVCEIKTAFENALLPIYARLLAVSPMSKEFSQRKPMDDVLETVFSRRYRKQAKMEVE